MTMMERMQSDDGFIAAIDQSGGSTPKALRKYGISEDAYTTDEQMFALVHAMRTRIVTNVAFNRNSILAAILFEQTMDNTVEGRPTSQYLWHEKQIVPFLKVDKGLEEEDHGVQLMTPIPNLDNTLQHAKSLDVFGTKMRSVIHSADADGIRAIVAQQFKIAKSILEQGMVPIIEPEINIDSSDKPLCEEILKQVLSDELESLETELPVMFKLTLPDKPDLYMEFCNHPNVLRVAALSGGYDRNTATAKLADNHGVIASFSRALTEGLHVDFSDDEFTRVLGHSIAAIAAASNT